MRADRCSYCHRVSIVVPMDLFSTSSQGPAPVAAQVCRDCLVETQREYERAAVGCLACQRLAVTARETVAAMDDYIVHGRAVVVQIPGLRGQHRPGCRHG